MEKQKQKSGYQKRKLKEESEKKRAKLPKITGFLKKKEPEEDQLLDSEPADGAAAAGGQEEAGKEAAAAPVATSSSPLDHRVELAEDVELENFTEEEPLATVTASTSGPGPPSHSGEEDDGDTGDNMEMEEGGVEEDKGQEDVVVLEHVKYPTDLGHFPHNVDSKVKHYIVSMGPCKPTGPFPRSIGSDKKSRSFSTNYYTSKTKSGLEIPRTWLCYSPKLDVAYCEPCWLFADRSLLGNKETWRTNNWQNLSSKIKVHESSHMHTAACMIYDQWRLHGTIDEEMEREIRVETTFWKQVLDRLINVTLTLATSNMPFRGHRETIGKANSGNFLSIIELMAKYDPVLKDLINRPARSYKYLSPAIQNELIDILGQRVKNDILDEIRAAPFFSVIMDTTQDIAKIDQMSQVYRYVTVERDAHGVASDVKINESFIGFREVTDSSAEELAGDITDSIESNGLQLSKCRGQGYDGAANMSGIYSGVQARIAAKEPAAVYVHCASHNLNLALNDSVKIQEISKFYDIVESVYVFFGHSIKRWAMLSDRESESDSAQTNDDDINNNITLKRICPTRWSSRNDSVIALRYRYSDVMKALAKLSLTSKKKDERDQALSLKRSIEKFNFICTIVLQSKILERTNVVSKLLQSKNADLATAVKLLDSTIKDLTAFRASFADAKLSAEGLADKWGVSKNFENVRQRKVKKHYDELAQDGRLADPESYYRVHVFKACLDVVISQLTQRFTGLRSTVDTFNVIQPETLCNATDDQLALQAKTLVEKYKKDITNEFPQQLVSFRGCLRDSIAKVKTIPELAKLLIVENNCISASFAEVCTVFLLFLTIPVTVASAERSFSKLKLIKSYLRSTMGQGRLSGLATLSIENDRARQLDVKDIIHDFAERKSRKIHL